MDKDSFVLPGVLIVIHIPLLERNQSLIEELLWTQCHHSLVFKLLHIVVKVNFGVSVHAHFNISLVFGVKLHVELKSATMPLSLNLDCC